MGSREMKDSSKGETSVPGIKRNKDRVSGAHSGGGNFKTNNWTGGQGYVD